MQFVQINHKNVIDDYNINIQKGRVDRMRAVMWNFISIQNAYLFGVGALKRDNGILRHFR